MLSDTGTLVSKIYNCTLLSEGNPLQLRLSESYFTLYHVCFADDTTVKQIQPDIIKTIENAIRKIRSKKLTTSFHVIFDSSVLLSESVSSIFRSGFSSMVVMLMAESLTGVTDEFAFLQQVRHLRKRMTLRIHGGTGLSSGK